MWRTACLEEDILLCAGTVSTVKEITLRRSHQAGERNHQMVPVSTECAGLSRAAKVLDGPRPPLSTLHPIPSVLTGASFVFAAVGLTQPRQRHYIKTRVSVTICRY